MDSAFKIDKTGVGFFISDEDIKGYTPLEAAVYSTDGKRVFGSPQKLKFFSGGINLMSVDRVNDDLETEFYIACSEHESKGIGGRMCLVKNGVMVYGGILTRTCSVTKKSEGLYLFKTHTDNFFAEVLPSALENARIGYDFAYFGAITRAFTKTACLPAAAPVLTVKEYLRGGATWKSIFANNF